MSGMSREKGKRGEREWAAKLREEGYDGRRGRQYQGGDDSPDVVCNELECIHWEVKRVEALRIYDAVDQAKAERADGQLAVVAHRKNDHPWLVVMPAEDFFKLVRSANLEDFKR